MVKKDKESYLSPKQLLSEQEYERHKGTKRIIKIQKLMAATRERQEKINRLAPQVRYNNSRFGAISRGIGAAFSFAKSPTQALQSRSMPVVLSKAPKESKTVRKGYNFQRGRPRGTYNKLYAPYGGVYGYRKILAQKLREQRLQDLRNAAITPQQQAVLRQIEARRAQERMSPEGRAVPSTYGKIALGGLMNEIDEAANLVP